MKIRKIACVGALAAVATLGLTSCSGTAKAYAGFDENSAKYDSAKYSDSAINKTVLGEFDEIYAKAKENTTDLAKRYAEMAVAEAKLLESGVFVPTTTQGGMYAYSSVVPRMIPDTLWGNDYERLHKLMVCTSDLKVADRDAIKDIQKKAKVTAAAEDILSVFGLGTSAREKYRSDVKAYLSSKGYALKRSYSTVYTSDPKTWDVLGTSRAADSEAIIQTYDGLVEYNELGQIAPALAESWTISPDYKTFTFTIRSGAKWVKQDGTEYGDVTAADFVAGFQHMLDAAGGLEYLVDGVVEGVHDYLAGKATFDKVGVSATGNKVTYTLTDTCPYFMTMLGYGIFAPLNKQFFEAEGGKFGADFDPTAESYKYGSSANDILTCGPFRVTDSTAKTKIEFTKNEKYWNVNDLDIDKVTWEYTDGKDVQKTYNEHKEGKLDACTLNTTTIPVAKADTAKAFADYAYVSDTNATTYNAFLNVKRQSYKNQDGKAKSKKSQKAADNASIALLNNDFRLALCHSIDRVTYNAQSTGEEVAAYSLRNTYTPGNFVTLNSSVTVKINDKDVTFKAGTEYGEIVQAQLTADGSKIVAYKDGSSDGYDGWYNKTAAKEYLDKAVEALAKENITVDAKHPIEIDLPTFTGSELYSARANAFKKSVEDALGNFVKVNLVSCKTADDWYNAGYYTETGKEANYDIYDLSGWGSDYGDPSTYLDTMYADAQGAGYMIKCIGIY